jgi:hypothetical protein
MPRCALHDGSCRGVHAGRGNDARPPRNSWVYLAFIHTSLYSLAMTR